MQLVSSCETHNRITRPGEKLVEQGSEWWAVQYSDRQKEESVLGGID